MTADTKTSHIECEGERKGNAEYKANDTKPAEAVREWWLLAPNEGDWRILTFAPVKFPGKEYGEIIHVIEHSAYAQAIAERDEALGRAADQMRELRLEIERLRAALEFYADHDNFRGGKEYEGEGDYTDMGDRARNALSGAKPANDSAIASERGSSLKVTND